MKKQVAKTLAIIVTFLTVLTVMNFQLSEASNVVTVPDDYQTIGAAINHANQGDTIVVKQGTYAENLFVNKQITLQGEDSKTTIIKGQGGPNKPSVLTLTADGIRIRDLP
jgi:pectin methylesterase-like acyl-CoA thioesterase